MKNRGLKDGAVLFLKGMAMGAADVVPGVSGGTVAFITGIYQELVDTIKGIKPQLVKTLFTEGPKKAWADANATFLALLLGGIVASVATMAKGITWLIATQPVLVWSFFLGLIIASTLLIGKHIRQWGLTQIAALILGGAIAFYITVAAPSQIPEGLHFIFLAGCIAICAMILPGISGSFILLLMGAYGTVLGSVTGLVDGLKAVNVDAIVGNGSTVVVFIFGCLVGILAFSHVLSFMFQKAYDTTMALLTGFMVGSLNKVWPWKEVVEWRTNSHGEQVPFLESNVLPATYEAITGTTAQVLPAIALVVLGFALVMVLERMAARS